MYTGYSSVTTDLIPVSAPVVFAYADGDYAQMEAVKEHCPRARVVSITTVGAVVATMYDFEAGALAYGEAASRVEEAHAHGIARPIIYAALDAMESDILPTLREEFQRDQYRLLPAHFTDTPELPAWADGIQWTQTALGRNLNEYLLRDNFFGTPKKTPDRTYTLTLEWDDTAKDWRVSSPEQGTFHRS